MDFIVKDENLNAIKVIDIFESFIWTERFSSFGDFEITTTPIDENLDVFRIDRFVVGTESDYCMIIDTIEITTSADEGAKLIVSGRSLEYLLDRRIIWDQTILKGNLEECLEKLFNDALISPVDPDRKVEGFRYIKSQDLRISELTISTQMTGTNLLTAIQKISEENKLGFKMTLTNDNEIEFRLYMGEDRSYSQDSLPYVVFSPSFDNLINSNYIESQRNLKTVALVAGEGEGSARRKKSVPIDKSGTGWNRRELFVDARDISSNNGEISSEKYEEQLTQRGKNYLSENTIEKVFDGSADTFNKYIYGRDFYLGDVVQIENEYGLTAAVKVTELIRTHDVNGIEVFPAFTTVT